MNLPQRKKSAEEIAKLREELGVFAQPPAPQALSPQATEEVIAPPPEPIRQEAPAFVSQPLSTSAPLPVVEQLPTPGISPLPSSATPRGPKPVSSLRKSERIPVLPTVTPIEDHPSDGIVVKSLRKSEQLPLPVLRQEAPASSHLPTQRHTGRDLNIIRQKEALAARLTPPPPKLLAPLPLVIFGYVSALMAPALTYFESEIHYSAGFSAAALLIIAWIFVKKPQSRAHAAFIFVISFFAILYMVFHYFPPLRHVS